MSDSDGELPPAVSSPEVYRTSPAKSTKQVEADAKLGAVKREAEELAAKTLAVVQKRLDEEIEQKRQTAEKKVSESAERKDEVTAKKEEQKDAANLTRLLEKTVKNAVKDVEIKMAAKEAGKATKRQLKL